MHIGHFCWLQGFLNVCRGEDLHLCLWQGRLCRWQGWEWAAKPPPSCSTSWWWCSPPPHQICLQFFHQSQGIVWELRSCHQRSPEMSWSAICSDLHHQISRQDEIFVNAKPEGIKNQRRIRSCPNGWEKFTVRGSSVDWGKFLAEPQAATTLRPRRRLPSQAALRPTPTVSLLSLPGELAYSYFQSNLLFACLLGWKQIKDYLDTTSS